MLRIGMDKGYGGSIAGPPNTIHLYINFTNLNIISTFDSQRDLNIPPSLDTYPPAF